MESFAYILILALAISTLFFAIAFRDPRRSASDLTLRSSMTPAKSGGFLLLERRGFL